MKTAEKGISILSMVPHILTDMDFSYDPGLVTEGLHPGDVVWLKKEHENAH